MRYIYIRTFLDTYRFSDYEIIKSHQCGLKRKETENEHSLIFVYITRGATPKFLGEPKQRSKATFMASAEEKAKKYRNA